MKTALLPLIISTLSPSLFGGEIANIVHALSTPTSFLTDSSTLAQRSLKTQKKKALKGEKKVIANNKKGKHAKKAKSGAPSSLPSSPPSSKNIETVCTESVKAAEQKSFGILDKLRYDLLPFDDDLTGYYLVLLTDYIANVAHTREVIDIEVDCDIVPRLQNADNFSVTILFDEATALKMVIEIIEKASNDLKSAVSVFEDTSEEGGTGINISAIQEATNEGTKIFEELKNEVENNTSLTVSPSLAPTVFDCSKELFENGMSQDAVKRSFVAAKLSALIYDLVPDSTADKKATYNDVFWKWRRAWRIFLFPT